MDFYAGKMLHIYIYIYVYIYIHIVDFINIHIVWSLYICHEYNIIISHSYIVLTYTGHNQVNHQSKQHIALYMYTVRMVYLDTASEWVSD